MVKKLSNNSTLIQIPIFPPNTQYWFPSEWWQSSGEMSQSWMRWNERKWKKQLWGTWLSILSSQLNPFSAFYGHKQDLLALHLLKLLVYSWILESCVQKKYFSSYKSILFIIWCYNWCDFDTKSLKGHYLSLGEKLLRLRFPEK